MVNNFTDFFKKSHATFFFISLWIFFLIVVIAKQKLQEDKYISQLNEALYKKNKKIIFTKNLILCSFSDKFDNGKWVQFDLI